MASGLMSLFAERMKHQVIDEVLREIGLLPQLYEHFLASDDKTVVSLPWRNYCRALSQPLFTYVSDFYGAFLRHSPSERNCSVCLSQHSRNQLCLPDLFQKDGLDLLFDMLERRRFYLCAEDDLVSLIRICGYLLINCDILHALLLNLLSLDEVRRSESGPAFVYELYRNGFMESAGHFAQGIDHPNFYSLLKRNQSYRQVKRQLRNYLRYREFAVVYTYPSGRVKFSKVRAAFFGGYYSLPPMEPDNYPECGW